MKRRLYQKDKDRLILLGEQYRHVMLKPNCMFISNPEYTKTIEDNKIIINISEPTIKSRLIIVGYHILIDKKYLFLRTESPILEIENKPCLIIIRAEDELGNLGEKTFIKIQEETTV